MSSLRIILPALLLSCLLAAPAAAEPQTRVYLNGQPYPVFFNDGDSFRVLAGPMAGVKARLGGYNTLESFGAVHRWGKFTKKELYVLSKMPVLIARRGTWKCTSKRNADGYGRELWDCPGLRHTLVKAGLAHAMTVTWQPSDPKLLAAQREAIRHKRGIWAHGVPAFIVTSLHSAEERNDGGPVYNRLVSTTDGSSVKWMHSDKYEECQEVCHTDVWLTADGEKAVLDRLHADASLDAALVDVPKGKVRNLVLEYLNAGRLFVDPVKHDAAEQRLRQGLQAALAKLDGAGLLGPKRESAGACVTHVDFRRRFGAAKAACLK